MIDPIEDRNVRAIRPLATPAELKGGLPLGPSAQRVVAETRAAIVEMLGGGDRGRWLVVVGPCSIHDPAAAREYARSLRAVAEETRDALLVVMRTYFEKPRTTVGWKGFLNDPHLDGSCDVATGIREARALLLDILELGLPCAGELLDPISPQYLSDLYAWAAIGARTCESQTHRELVSGASMPVGLKNPTDGSIESAANAMIAVQHPHAFLGVDVHGRASVVETGGNPNCHLVLRGGRSGPNYSAGNIARASGLAPAPGRRVMVDCSHGNSERDPARQAVVALAVVEAAASARLPLGLMIESNLEPGRQDWTPGARLRRGVSITDACIGLDETRRLLPELAERIRAAR